MDQSRQHCLFLRYQGKAQTIRARAHAHLLNAAHIHLVVDIQAADVAAIALNDINQVILAGILTEQHLCIVELVLLQHSVVTAIHFRIQNAQMCCMSCSWVYCTVTYYQQVHLDVMELHIQALLRSGKAMGAQKSRKRSCDSLKCEPEPAIGTASRHIAC